MGKLSRIDWGIIDNRVRATAEHKGINCSKAYLSLALIQYFPGIESALAETVTDGSDDRGIDAIHIIENDDRADIYLFQSKYRENIESTSRTINDSECLKVSLFIEELFERSERLADCDNFLIVEMVKRIWEIHDRGVFCEYHIVYCSNGNGLSPSATGIMQALCAKHSQARYEFYGPDQLLRDLGAGDCSKETGIIQVIGKEAYERADGDVRGVIASVDARSFVELIQTADKLSVKRHLFDDNLRVFLGSNGGYNPEIIETATSPDSHLFWYLNNGITITCRNYSYNKGHANPRIKLEDFQIVNGAQTSHSLVEASRIDQNSLDNVVLMVRVYATDRTDIAERVAVATNSQARIQNRDLRANHPTMKKLELAFKEQGYFFERKRNMHSDRPLTRRIDALKLGQIIMAYYLREPDRARGESDSIFDARFNQVFHDNYNIVELCNLYEFYRIIENLREKHQSSGVKGEKKSDFEYLVYGHWFILYAAGLLIQDRSSGIPEGKAAEDLAREAISLVAKACSPTRSVAHYQMFRSPKTKRKIISEMSGGQPDMFGYLSVIE